MIPMPAVPIQFVFGIFGDKETWEDNVPYRRDLAPGSAQWSHGNDGKEGSLLFVCPCGCGAISGLHVAPGYGRERWTWDGDREHPTLRPSVLRTSGCRWHGYLTKGVWTPV